VIEGRKKKEKKKKHYNDKKTSLITTSPLLPRDQPGNTGGKEALVLS
jgi:hypothetical protein